MKDDEILTGDELTGLLQHFPEPQDGYSYCGRVAQCAGRIAGEKWLFHDRNDLQEPFRGWSRSQNQSYGLEISLFTQPERSFDNVGVDVSNLRSKIIFLRYFSINLPWKRFQPVSDTLKSLPVPPNFVIKNTKEFYDVIWFADSWMNKDELLAQQKKVLDSIDDLWDNQNTHCLNSFAHWILAPGIPTISTGRERYSPTIVYENHDSLVRLAPVVKQETSQKDVSLDYFTKDTALPVLGPKQVADNVAPSYCDAKEVKEDTPAFYADNASNVGAVLDTE